MLSVSHGDLQNRIVLVLAQWLMYLTNPYLEYMFKLTIIQVTSPDITCRAGAIPGALTAPARAGSQMKFQWYEPGSV
jgi:hypothetical protein